MAQQPKINAIRNHGFTLIEIIVGLVAISASFIILTAFIFPQAQRSAEPIMQVRAAALGQAMLDEIMGRSFDQNSDRVGGDFRCNTTGDPEEEACTAPEDFGPDGDEDRANFNDVDDFHRLHESIGIQDALGIDLGTRYANFDYSIDVCYSDIEGTCNSSGMSNYKRVLVIVTTPFGQDFAFSAVRGNY